jgi:hypothetical protein
MAQDVLGFGIELDDLSAARGVTSLICRSPMRRPLLPTVSQIICMIRS